MEELLNKVKELAYKERFSIYHRPEKTVVRTYPSSGGETCKVERNTMEEALEAMIEELSPPIGFKTNE